MSTNKVNTVPLDVLIKKCMSRDRKSCEKLYKMYYPRLMPTVRRYISEHAIAEEVLHNAFIKIFENLKQYDFRGSFEGWMRQIAFHCVSDYIRSTTKYRDNIVTTEEVYHFTIDEDIVQKMNYDFYLKLIDELPENERAIFNMYAIDGYKHKEIAEMLQIPVGTSKWTLSQARKRLQEKILQLKNIRS